MNVPNKFLELAESKGLNHHDAAEFYMRKTGKRGWLDLTYRAQEDFEGDPRQAHRAFLNTWNEWRAFNAYGDTAAYAVASTPVNADSFYDQAMTGLEKLIGEVREVKGPNDTSKLIRALDVAGDLHAPFHDPKSLDQLLRSNSEELFLMGDVVDMLSATSHRQTCDYVTYQEEIAVGRAILEELAKKYKTIKLIAGNHDCFDEDTEILTDQGWKSFEWLSQNPNTSVGTLDRFTGKINWEVPIKVTYEDYSGPMVEIKRPSCSLVVTPNHRMLVKKGDSSLDFVVVNAGDMFKSGKKLVPLSGENNNETDLNVTDDQLRLFGFQCANSIMFERTVGVKSSMFPELTELVKKLGYEDNDVHFNSFTAEFKFIRLTEKGMSDLNLNIHDLTPRQFDVVLNAIVDCVGERSEFNPDTSFTCKWGSVSGISIDDFQGLLTCNGWASTISKEKSGVKKIKARKGGYCTVDTSEKSDDISLINNYIGKIGCAHVASDTLVVRRKGSTSITCNSRPIKKMQNLIPALMPMVVHPLVWLTQGLHNVELLSLNIPDTKPQLTYGKDYNLNFAGIYNDCLFGHFECFCGADAVNKLDTWLSQWNHVLKIPQPKAVLQAHNHRLSLEYTATGRPLIHTGCMARPQEYQFLQHGKYSPGVNGFVRLFEKEKGGYEFNSTQLIFTG